VGHVVGAAVVANDVLVDADVVAANAVRVDADVVVDNAVRVDADVVAAATHTAKQTRHASGRALLAPQSLPMTCLSTPTWSLTMRCVSTPTLWLPLRTRRSRRGTRRGARC